jgi:hypothetical protein
MAQVARLDFETIERPTITVNMAGDEKQLPVTFNDADLKLLGKAENEQAGLTAFFVKYLGEDILEIGDDQLKKLLTVWTEQRRLLDSPSLGE